MKKYLIIFLLAIIILVISTTVEKPDNSQIAEYGKIEKNKNGVWETTKIKIVVEAGKTYWIDNEGNIYNSAEEFINKNK